LEEFLSYLLGQDLAQATREAYHRDLTGFWLWWAKDAQSLRGLESLSGTELAHYKEHLLTLKVRPTTVKRKFESLRRLCRWAFEHQLIAADLSKGLKPVRLASAVNPRGLSDGEVHALLRAAGSSAGHVARRNYAIVQLFIQTGLRVAELASLLIRDAKFSTRTGQIKIFGKGSKERVVPLNAPARRALQAYLETRATPEPEEPLFVSARGQAMAVRSMQHLITELARRARIEGAVSPHTLRHTFSHNYLKACPGQLVELATLLGHESLDTTAVYTRPSLEALAQDLEKSNFNAYSG
jgi:integrase/recombinase XerC